MKILYVEDDLGGNIPRILNLFGDLLPREVRRGLQEAEVDERGASSQEVKKLLDKSHIIHACYGFADAIRVVRENENLGDFALFILDRNLTDGQGDWDPNEICKAAGIEDENLLLPFLSREGDFLVHLLIPRLQANLLQHSVYFLTANTTDAELRSTPEFNLAMHACNIGPQNFIQKSDTEACQRLRDIIMSIDALRIKVQHLELFKAIELCSPKQEGKLLKILSRRPRNEVDWAESMVSMRTILESAIFTVRYRFTNQARQQGETVQEAQKDLFGGYRDGRSISGIFERDSDVASCCKTLQKLASVYANHDPEERELREDIYNICYGAFRVILRWAGEQLSKT